MKSAGSYIGSFIFSILFIFSLLGSAGCLIADRFITPEGLISLAEEKDIPSLVEKELEKHFNERYAVTGIPGSVYMDVIDSSCIRKTINSKIEAGFSELSSKYSYGSNSDTSRSPEQTALEESIHAYFKEYADSVGYVIKDTDDPYFTKLKYEQENAVRILNESCDVFKFDALSKHGILSKIRPIYEKLSFLKILCLGASAFLILMMTVSNFKVVKDVLYWLGASGLSAGILGGAPCLYLLRTDYFSAFTIKQPQIYTAYTSAMKLVTQRYLTASVIIACAGILFIILYGICCKLSKSSE